MMKLLKFEPLSTKYSAFLIKIQETEVLGVREHSGTKVGCLCAPAALFRVKNFKMAS